MTQTHDFKAALEVFDNWNITAQFSPWTYETIRHALKLAAIVTGEPSEGMISSCVDAEFGIIAKHLSYAEIFKAMIAEAQRQAEDV